MKISVVIPSKNGLHHLKECLPTVIDAARKSTNPIDVTVVDDCSNDDTPKEFSALFPNVRYLRTSPDANGACIARNIGVQSTQCDWICFLDNDVFLEPEFFDKASKYLRDNVFAVTCCGYAAYPKVAGTKEQNDGVKLFSWQRGYPRFTGNIKNENLDSTQEYECFGAQGAYFFMNRKWFDELDGYDPILSPYLLEETDLVYRGMKRGGKIIYAFDTAPRHKCGGTIQSTTNPYTKYLSKRNRIIFVWKNIHDNKLLLSNIFWTILRPCPKAIYECIKLLPEILKKRCIERKLMKITDIELLKKSKQLLKEFN